MIEYVVGFLFDPTADHVALIRKIRPTWQQGFYNGIGGKIEPDETPEFAMRREFIEETGVDVESWRKFAVLNGKEFRMHIYHAFEQRVHGVRTTTDEAVSLHFVKDLKNINTIPNLQWLIPMALAVNADRASSFVIEEQYS